MEAKEIIARRIAKELHDGDVINLGIGLPTMVADFVPSNISVYFQSENGMINLGPTPVEESEDYDLTNAGGNPVTILKGGAFFDSAMSFSIIRGHHVDLTVLGSLQVDELGNIANWIVPGKLVPGMGGAMDLLVGAKKVFVAMTHTNKGLPKILKRCSLPLTAVGEVDWIFTELAVIQVTKEGLVLKEYHESTTIDEVCKLTEANLIIDPTCRVMEL